MTDWLIKFGLGGVQEFISQARKLRDLASGSRIISEVSRGALEAAVEWSRDGGHQLQVLLPHISGAAGKSACPHQVVMKLNGVDDENVKDLAALMEDAARSTWKNHLFDNKLHDKEFGEEKGVLDGESDAWKSQLNRSLEVYWAAVQLDEKSGQDSSKAFNRLIRAYDDRRLTRTFQQFKPLKGHDNWSCSQCGSRAALMQPGPSQKELLASREKGLFGARDRLCAVCLGKRWWSRNNDNLDYSGAGSFPSTHRLAANRVLECDNYEGLRVSLKSQGISENQIPDLLNMDESDFREQISAQKKAENVTEADRLEAIRSVLFGSGEGGRDGPSLKTSPYYALMVFDGDEMGKWFSGERFDEKDDLFEKQFELSKALQDFAFSIKEEVKRLQALPVYMGGDDGFVAAPLDSVLPVMKRVHELWAKHIPALGTNGLKPTVSAHVSIVHQKAPLQAVVSELHELLDRTKEDAGRDAFSVRCAVRAGGISLMMDKWKRFDSFVDAVHRFTTWRMTDLETDSGRLRNPDETELNKRREDLFPSRLPRQILATTKGLFTDGQLDLPQGLEWEIDRVFERGDGSHGGWNSLREWIVGRARDGGSDPGNPRNGWNAMSGGLEVVTMLARELEWGDAS